MDSLQHCHKIKWRIGTQKEFQTKRDCKRKKYKYKARLVAKGYVQEQGIDFDEVFTPVARIEIVRLILALAAYHGWQVHHLDVKSAFLHGDLKEEVYVTQPERFVQQGNTGKPRAWNVKLDQTLKSLDFKKCNLKQAVYTKRSKTSTLIVGVYVDDLIITGTPRKVVDALPWDRSYTDRRRDYNQANRQSQTAPKIEFNSDLTRAIEAGNVDRIRRLKAKGSTTRCL
ncbi:ribonuclease H-like domain, reverse transcriptase, RNA-dependent DNA polymerase [Tanacetum coccineum]